MTVAAVVERLRRAAAVLDATGDPELAPVADGLRRYVEGAAEGARLDRELGLVARPGAAPWWQADAFARRDAAIRRLAASFPGSNRAKAGEVAREIRHYAATGWPRDRARGGPYPDSPRRRALFEIFTVERDPPSGWRQLYKIIAAEIAPIPDF